eukprot:CAMPEP_0172513260 /NCGR_PEP_ID=MMETSP1066-20121228/251197_1 /TAXON_ID=671091 /ORGANISM="Coscinodiscus wailesii, Strain CCMP2513" /LENGTH=73 /DNA_ID=CAMNT_0013293459 /DNA_START=11 /DNA_END=228 /DNA_ORIENTATION=+
MSLAALTINTNDEPNQRPSEITIEGINESVDDIHSDSEDETDDSGGGAIYNAYARVFFQGRDDRGSTQLLPSL